MGASSGLCIPREWGWEVVFLGRTRLGGGFCGEGMQGRSRELWEEPEPPSGALWAQVVEPPIPKVPPALFSWKIQLQAFWSLPVCPEEAAQER